MSCKLTGPCGWLAAALLLCGTAVAQQPTAGVTYTPGTFSPPYYPGGGGYYGGGGGGWGWGWGGGVGSTPAGSYLTGLGNAIRAQGQFNLDTSAAAINLEEAQKRAIENRKLWTNTYFEMRRINQEYRNARRPRPESPSTWVRRAQEAAPDRLSASELDPVTGRIAWPRVLVGNEYQGDRERLDRLFTDRALAHGAIGVETHAEIRIAIDETLARLRARIREYGTDEYLAARRFLTSLRHEATFPTTGSLETASREPVPPPVSSN